MHRMKTALLILAFGALAAVLAHWQRSPPIEGRLPATVEAVSSPVPAFDYYLIALSWSPSWCEAHPDDTEQCGRRGYGFILHGLWPQFEAGGGPRECPGGQRPDRATIDRALAFMPSRGLIDHEWRSHGTCTGLDPQAYFELSDRAFAAVRIPPELTAGAAPVAMSAEQVRTAFVQANEGFREDMLSVSCHADKLAEVRICVDRDLEPRSCGRGNRMQCPRDTPLRIPRIR